MRFDLRFAKISLPDELEYLAVRQIQLMFVKLKFYEVIIKKGRRKSTYQIAGSKK